MNLTELLTLLWLLVALLTWLFTHLKSRKEQKINNTVQLINNLSTVQHLLDADIHIRDAIRLGSDISPHTINAGFEKKLVILLDYYEFLARLYQDGAADSKSLIHLRGRLIVATYQASKAYIVYWREKLNRPDLYKMLEMLNQDISIKQH